MILRWEYLLQCIFIACSVNLGITSTLTHSQTFDQTITDKENDGNEVQKNLQNLFESITKNEARTKEIYLEILKHKVAKDRQAFHAMKEELQKARNRNYHKKRNSYNGDSVLAVKRETNEIGTGLHAVKDNPESSRVKQSAESNVPTSVTPQSRFRRVESSKIMVNMEQQKIIPDVIPESPTSIMEVRYAGNHHAHLGNVLTPTLVKDKPVVFWTTEPGAYYTLCMTDPDEPSRKDPKFREWLHWLIVNIPASNSSELDITPGEVIADYIGAGPPEGSGLHRYVFLAYKQPIELTTVVEPRLTNNSGDGRTNFKIAKFAEKYKLGTPVAGNFFNAEWDDYVPILYRRLAARS